MPVLVGTSGWQYRDWRDAFYPPGVPQRQWLEYYAEHFPTVENNGTFYRLQQRSTFESWRQRSPPGFVMAIKASRYLTHVRMLRDPADPVRRLMEAADGLGDRLGPVLLQLPPTLKADPGALDECLRCFPARVRVAVEPRHPSWWSDDTQRVLAGRGAALCWADRDENAVTPLWRTADWGYLRFHAGSGTPVPRYTAKTLGSWARRVTATWDTDETVYVYFNNDHGGAAVHDADSFRRLATSSS